MDPATRRQTLVIGVGNAYRGDDAVGLRAAKTLRDGRFAGRVVQCDGDGAAVMEWLRGAKRVYLVDACRSGAEAGAVRRIDAVAEAFPRDLLARTSHTFGVAEAIETARALNELPDVLVVYAIEGAEFSHGAPLTPAVQRAADAVARQIEAEAAAKP